ncbi:MAG: aldo/keto reductase, partial [Elusimicrobia bacterium]|nr:aldo/keto reductase [Elusimicrobiota bacterium]
AYAMEHGINYYDTAYFYHMGESEKTMGKVLKKYPRESFYLATKMPIFIIQSKEQLEQIFKEQLERCRTNYFDFYLCHSVNAQSYETLKKFDVYEFLNKKKQEGKIKYLGFSFHDTPELLEEVVKKYKWDFVQLQMNAIDWEMVNAKKQYEIAKENGLQVTIMNPLRGGQLSTLNDAATEILKQANPNASLSSWGIRYVASLPNVLSVLSGMTTMEHLEDNVKTLTNFKPLDDKEREIYQQAIEKYKLSGAIACTGCKYCIDCPVGIEIPKIFSIYNQHKNGTKYRDWQFTMAYEQIPAEKRADKCINCGICKKKCPQKLDIPNLLKDVDKLYKQLKS